MSTTSASAQVGALELRGVTKRFVTDWRGNTRLALEDVTFAAPAGRVTALVGPNGSGKTTFLKICAGLTAPSTGECVVNARSVAYVPDDLAFPGYLTAREALTRCARLFGLDSASAEAQVADALEQVFLTHEARRAVREFSRGMRQRLALAQALLGSPDVLLLDEPAAALDPWALQRFALLVSNQRAAGRTVLISSHFLPQIAELADEFVMLDAGKIIFSGHRGELESRGGLEPVYLRAVRA